MNKKLIRVIIGGGGTGGHVFPAISIANAIKKMLPDAEFLFVGANGKIEMEKVPKAGYTIKGLWISGFHRSLTWKNLLFPARLVVSLVRSYGIVRRFKPDVAVGVGGYASWPVLEVASRLGIPTLIQEQNSYAGVTNKLLAKRVDKVCVAYDKMERYFPAGKLLLTGNPVRNDLKLAPERQGEARRKLGLNPTTKTIFVFGGSLGARSINDAMAAQSTLLESVQGEVQVLWQCGKLYWEEFSRSDSAQLPHVHITAFVDGMDMGYAAADVVICRAGALAIAELSLVAKPVVLVPSPNVAEDHQTKNARALVEKNAAILVRDEEAKEQMLSTALDLIRDEGKKAELIRNIGKLARPEAAEDIARAVIELVG